VNVPRYGMFWAYYEHVPDPAAAAVRRISKQMFLNEGYYIFYSVRSLFSGIKYTSRNRIPQCFLCPARGSNRS
jgi:hypothetical protein